MSGLIRFMWSLTKQGKWPIVIGACFLVFKGGNQPVRGIIFAHLILDLTFPLSQSGKTCSQPNSWRIIFLMPGFVQVLAFSVQYLAFAQSHPRWDVGYGCSNGLWIRSVVAPLCILQTLKAWNSDSSFAKPRLSGPGTLTMKLTIIQ